MKIKYDKELEKRIHYRIAFLNRNETFKQFASFIDDVNKQSQGKLTKKAIAEIKREIKVLRPQKLQRTLFILLKICLHPFFGYFFETGFFKFIRSHDNMPFNLSVE